MTYIQNCYIIQILQIENWLLTTTTKIAGAQQQKNGVKDFTFIIIFDDKSSNLRKHYS